MAKSKNLLDTPAPLEGEDEQAGVNLKPGELPAGGAPGGSIMPNPATLAERDSLGRVERTEGSEPMQGKPPREIRLVSDPVQRPKLVDEIVSDLKDEIGSHETIGGAAKQARTLLGERYVFRDGGNNVVDPPPWLVNDLAMRAGKIKVQKDAPPPRRPERSKKGR